jgi:hypothetical protein
MKELKKAYNSKKLILFVGAGVSMNLGLPSWNDLVSKIAEDLDYDPAIFATYGTPLALAEYYRMKKGSIGPLRSWMDREWHGSHIEIDKSAIHRNIAVGGFERIYTTNYDRWLEKAHEAHGIPFKKIVRAADFASESDSDRLIVKLHGDFDDDDSIVLDESSYFERLSFESPLDIKLRADVIGSSVLFIGYSISDPNIRLLFYKLTKMWSGDSLATSRPKSYLFSHRPNPVAKDVLAQWGIEMLVSKKHEPQEALEAFLKELVE